MAGSFFDMGRDSTTSRTVSCLGDVISRFGIPQIIVSDNGPQFTSSEFQSFCAQNGIQHKRSPPYHPASNGQVERMVRELKKALRSKLSDVPIATQLHRFLFSYRNTRIHPREKLRLSCCFHIVPQFGCRSYSLVSLVPCRSARRLM